MMCGPNDDMTNPLTETLKPAEVWCAECDHPADGPDALCGLHRRLRELRRPRQLSDFDVILIKMALQTAAIRYEEAATATPDDPYFITAHRKNMAELAAEYRRVAGLLA